MKKNKKQQENINQKNKQSQNIESSINLRTKIIFGKNNCMSSLEKKEISKIYLQKTTTHGEVLKLIKQKHIPYVFVDKKYLDNLTQQENHQGIAMIVSPFKYLELEELIVKNKAKKNPMIIMLDEVQDPQNLGAIARSVDAFSIDGIIFNKRRNVQITSSVEKVSTGALNYVDMTRVNNLRQAIKKLKKEGYFIGYLDMDGQTEVNKVNYDMPLVIIIGGEDKGVTESIKKECDFGIKINQTGHVNSLNVASATSILCYQKNISRLEINDGGFIDTRD